MPVIGMDSNHLAAELESACFPRRPIQGQGDIRSGRALTPPLRSPQRLLRSNPEPQVGLAPTSPAYETGTSLSRSLGPINRLLLRHLISNQADQLSTGSYVACALKPFGNRPHHNMELPPMKLAETPVFRRVRYLRDRYCRPDLHSA